MDEPPPSYPASEPAPLPAPALLDRRAVGHGLGATLLVIGSSSSVLAILRHGKWSRWQVYLTVAGGIGSAFYGVYWFRKGYFRDPEAVKQYREIFVREGIATAVKKYSWSGLRQFVTDKELATKFDQEIGARPLDAMWSAYGDALLNDALRSGVLSAEFLRARFMAVFVAPVAARAYPTLLEATRKMGDFALQQLKVDSSWIRAALKSDEKYSSLTWADFVRNDIPFLVTRNLVDRSDVHDRFFAEVAKGATFETLFRNDQKTLMFVVDNNVVKPAELRALFNRTRDTHSLSELVDLYWSWPLRSHGRDLLGSLEFDKFRILQTELEGLEQILAQQLDAVDATVNNMISEEHENLERMKRVLLENKATGTPVAETQRLLQQAQRRYDETQDMATHLRTTRKAELQVKMQAQRLRINKAWSEWLLQRREKAEDAAAAPAASSNAAASSTSNNANTNNNNISITLNIPGLAVAAAPQAHVDVAPTMQPIPVPTAAPPPYNPAAMAYPEP